ncbi:MFS general substrate transporter [Delitschia confertaspora ATCC 74209]|uniref:MFS general substrate transporter n=1 Tax=Delitschia confertaspora ATCC 74209 TaxID=1513339 RepID=A0A9P4MWF5_9PLEO|nr:MFS general substrate transporter [Delitschia confertaspora ATCC 74209]
MASRLSDHILQAKLDPPVPAPRGKSSFEIIMEKSDMEKIHYEEAMRETALSSDASGTADEFTWTVEEETAVRRKLDCWIVPITTVLYLLCFLDRVNIGNARIQGMGKDLKLVGVRFNWATSIFYIVYMFFEVPSNILLKRIGPKYYLPLLVCGFGFVSLCTAFVKNFETLLVARAFLGIFEGGVMPGLAFFISCFYKREELYLRIGIYVSAASLAGAFGGLLAAALAKIPEWGTASMPIHTWRNIFFFEGLITVLIGLLTPFIMPTHPADTWFLNERQRRIAAARLHLRGGMGEEEKVKPKHVARALFNINNWISAMGFFVINITVQGVSLFMPTILNDLGWTATQAQLHTVPPYVCACAVAVFVAFLSDKTRQRGLYLALFTFPTIAGFCILRWVMQPNVRYFGVFLITIGAFPGGPGFLSWGVNNSAGPAVRAVSSALIVTIGTAGGVLATWTYVIRESPRYPTGHTINICGQIAALLLATAGIVYCRWENQQRDRGRRDHRLEGLGEEERKELGYRHPDFRYIS